MISLPKSFDNLEPTYPTHSTLFGRNVSVKLKSRFFLLNSKTRASLLPTRRAAELPYFRRIPPSAEYRPISLTSQVTKISERIIRDKIVSRMEENGILCNNQHGLRKAQSCLLRYFITLTRTQVLRNLLNEPHLLRLC